MIGMSPGFAGGFWNPRAKNQSPLSSRLQMNGMPMSPMSPMPMGQPMPMVQGNQPQYPSISATKEMLDKHTFSSEKFNQAQPEVKNSSRRTGVGVVQRRIF